MSMPPRPSIAVAVVMQREAQPNRWEAWRHSVVDVALHEEAAGKYEAACKALKGLVPEDAAEVSGGGIICKRDRAGRLRFSKEKKR